MAGFFTMQDVLDAVLDRGARLIDWRGEAGGEDLPDLCAALLSRRGEASGVALAAQILAGFKNLSGDEQLEFFEMLAARFDPDAEAARCAAEDYAANPTAVGLSELIAAAEPPRQELLRRLNLAPGGTAKLVAMRAALIGLLKDHPHLRRVDADFRHLFSSWFNRGFLVLEHIDWGTSAELLDKIIAYEAVHQIDDWDDLRRRLKPSDRRCFGFFHPAMPGEPLIFVEVALTRDIPGSVQALLSEDREDIAAEDATTAVFYSISNCQIGLNGVSFGNFLIKQVAEDLSRELPGLKTFVTLSPAPSFAKWVRDKDIDGVSAEIADIAWASDPERADALEKPLMELAAEYYLEAKRPDGAPFDPVARFHLGNGATLHRINWLADTSPNGLARGAGVMVNYLYDLAKVETNHESFAETRSVVAARPVRALLPSPKKQKD